eukprot:TRINITY_DN436_c0_g1_i1.p1 TRINITY_DN436_c0_g1~~TRINITY_DN436_c0_g1_i1.p1  ORF type:complete len:108 (+),score=4.99 TRINITY_DN436_c0_g1_i1:75-398(+)
MPVLVIRKLYFETLCCYLCNLVPLKLYVDQQGISFWCWRSRKLLFLRSTYLELIMNEESSTYFGEMVTSSEKTKSKKKEPGTNDVSVLKLKVKVVSKSRKIKKYMKT